MTNFIIILAQKPIQENYAFNCANYECGGINIDGCRVEADWENDPSKRGFGYGWDSAGMKRQKFKDACSSYGKNDKRTDSWTPTQGRWPANLIHDGNDEVVTLFPVTLTNGRHGKSGNGKHCGMFGMGSVRQQTYFDKGSAARFFKSFNQ